MKKNIIIVLILTLVVGVMSCQKDSKIITPYISFKKGAGYTSKDDTVARNANLKIGIIASKSDASEVLGKLTKMVTYDNTIDSPISTTTISSNTTDSFSKDYSITTRNVAGTEKYVFTIYDQSGATNSISLIIHTN